MRHLFESAHVVDVNCRIGPARDRAWKFDDADGLERVMDRFGIDEAVVWHTAAESWSIPDGNRLLMEAIGGRDRLSPCLVAGPILGNAELPSSDRFAEQLREARPAGVRVFPATGNYRLHPFFADELLEVLERLHLPLFVEIQEVDPLDLVAATKEYADTPLVLLKAGFRFSRHLFSYLRKRPNVFVSIGNFVDTNLLENLVEEFGAERLLFGTDMPCLHPGPPMALVAYADIREEDKRKILGGNWQRIREGVAWT